MNIAKSAKLRQIRHKLMPSPMDKLVKKSHDSPVIDCKNGASDLNPLLCKHSQEDQFDGASTSTYTPGSQRGGGGGSDVDDDPCDCEECVYLEAFYTVLESVNLM